MDYQKHLETCRALTKGEWEVTYLSEEAIYITRGHRFVNGIHVADWIAKIDSGDDEKNEEAKLAEAEFIAFARNHMEQYIIRCMELEAENKRLTKQRNIFFHFFSQEHCTWRKDRNCQDKGKECTADNCRYVEG